MASVDVMGNGFRQCTRVSCRECCVGLGKMAVEDGGACCVGSAKYYYLAMYYRLCAQANFTVTSDHSFTQDVRKDTRVAAVCCSDGKSVSGSCGNFPTQIGGTSDDVETIAGECDSVIKLSCSGGDNRSIGDSGRLSVLQYPITVGCEPALCGFSSETHHNGLGNGGGNGRDFCVRCSGVAGARETGVEIPTVSTVYGDTSADVGGCSSVVDSGSTVGESQNVKVNVIHVETKPERNRRWRAERKELKKKRQAMNRDWRKGTGNGLSFAPIKDSIPSELRGTLEEKWKFQNMLAAEKARRDLEVLKASDIEQEKRRYRTKVSAATERNMVSIEKTHAMLRQTGNVPGEQVGGFAETVVSGVPGLDSGSGTISPDSSASMAEFRACQKALLDSEKEVQEYKRKIKIAIEKYGFPLEQVDYLDKEIWTDTQTNEAILDELYPNGYGKDTSLFDDGRFRAIGV